MNNHGIININDDLIKNELINLLDINCDVELDIVERSRRIVSIWRSLGLDDNNEYFIHILSIDSQTDHLPKGEVRKYWSKESLKKMDIESQHCEKLFAKTFEEASKNLLILLR